MEISKTKERAKLLLTIDPLNPVVGAIPEAKFRVTNVGESSALFGGAIAGLHISDSDTLLGNGAGYHWLKIGNALMKPGEHSEETVWWPAHHFVRYTQAVLEGEKEAVHLHGVINFRDAFDDWWKLRFHYIWRPYGVDVWMAHLQTTVVGEWESQNDESEHRIENPSKRRWWQFWRKPEPKAQNPN